jgi:hypothetical protein
MVTARPSCPPSLFTLDKLPISLKPQKSEPVCKENIRREGDEGWDDGNNEKMFRSLSPIDESEEEIEENHTPSQFYFPPTIEEVKKAYTDLGNLLKPWRKTGKGYSDLDLDKITPEWLSAMKLFCFNFIDMQQKAPDSPQWQAASKQMAESLGHGPYQA